MKARPGPSRPRKRPCSKTTLSRGADWVLPPAGYGVVRGNDEHGKIEKAGRTQQRFERARIQLKDALVPDRDIQFAIKLLFDSPGCGQSFRRGSDEHCGFLHISLVSRNLCDCLSQRDPKPVRFGFVVSRHKMAGLRVSRLSEFHQFSSRQSSKFDNYSRRPFSTIDSFVRAEISPATYALPFETSHALDDLKTMLLNDSARFREDVAAFG